MIITKKTAWEPRDKGTLSPGIIYSCIIIILYLSNWGVYGYRDSDRLFTKCQLGISSLLM